MYPNHFFYPPQHHPSFPIASLDPQSTHHTLPGVYPGTYYPGYGYGGYNTDWGLEQQQALLHNVNQVQMAGGSAAGMAATTNNDNYQCKWFTGGILCGQGFADVDDLIDHLNSVHAVRGSAAQKLDCQWLTDRGCCGKRCRRDGIKRHIEIHAGCKVRCTECGKPFSRKDTMRAHRKKQHGKK